MLMAGPIVDGLIYPNQRDSDGLHWVCRGPAIEQNTGARCEPWNARKSWSKRYSIRVDFGTRKDDFGRAGVGLGRICDFYVPRRCFKPRNPEAYKGLSSVERNFGDLG